MTAARMRARSIDAEVSITTATRGSGSGGERLPVELDDDDEVEGLDDVDAHAARRDVAHRISRAGPAPRPDRDGWFRAPCADDATRSGNTSPNA